MAIVAVALPFSGDLQQRGLPQPVVREHKVARERGRAGERAWLHLPRRASKALKALSGSPTRSSVQRLQRPRALAGCSKAHHACCNLPRPMISCSFFKLLSGGISIIALSEDPFYWTKTLDTSSSRRSPVCRGRVTKGLGFALSSSFLWFLLVLRDN